MKVFKNYNENLNYKDIIQMDGLYSASHILYNSSLKSKNKNIYGMPNSDIINSPLDNINSFRGVKTNIKSDEKFYLWKEYFSQYVWTFDTLITSRPNSVATIYIGRQAIELGIKYLLILKTNQVDKTHDLFKLSELLFSKYQVNDKYMDDVKEFCNIFSNYIEGGNVEYFRFPEYSKNNYFAGRHLDLNWLIWNMVIVILKLIHFSNLESEFDVKEEV